MNLLSDAPSSAAPTAFEAVILHLLAELGRAQSEAALQAVISDPSGYLTVSDALEFCRNSGVQAAFGPRALEAFDASLLPAVLLLKDGRALALHALDETRAVVFDPELGPGTGEIPRGVLAELYSGYALLMRRDARAAGSAEGAVAGHWFWSAMAQNRWTYIQVALAAVLTSVLGLSTSVFTMVVYDRILPNGATESLIALTFGISVALFFDFLIKMLRSIFIDRAGQKADHLMARRIFDHLLNLQLAEKRGSTGALASTLREFETLREFFTSATLVALVDLPFILLFLWVIWMIGGPLVVVPGLAVPLVLIIAMAVQPFLARLSEQGVEDGRSRQSVLIETISGLETIKATGAARFMRNRWERSVSAQSETGGRSRALTQFALNATGFVQQLAQILIVFYGVFLITAGVTSMGALIASVILTGRCLTPLAQIAQILMRLNQTRSSYRSLDMLMKSGSERPEGRSFISRPRLTGEIAFEEVRFSYPGQLTEALKGVSLRIAPGERVALLGRVGSGKSTLGRLLLGLYQPSAGAVRVDGVDIRQIDPGDLRRNIGAALQDSWLFSGTLKENIAIGALRPSDAEILAAAKTAGVEDFAARHPAGYDMPIGERGDGLSGGQRQSISLARALVGLPPVLLLDEPTSAMDVQKEAEVVAALREATAGATVLVITHRTSLLSLVDRVVVLDEGVIAFDGPVSELHRAAGLEKAA